ncbi:UPF0678 fatty acid-binding protein-like protein [Hibiscus syriacus]|uniref:UPF0678 fatty acid-binding protein-like protein n=1 Tax=Hibiscus syriacus TaxID=106335 RepID=A0A6A2ZM51_HIBSY|nr:uncharacterized membrane protein YuiD-like [Hibiscus syriacus]KAE8692222.1 UPF0678 fatty acid-binding protein-like protein [Hibiscus syriacus]
MVLHWCPSISIPIPKPLLTLTHRRNPKPKFSCFVVPNIWVDDIAQLAQNKVLVAAAASAAIGQLSKPFTSVILYGKDFDFKTAFQAGGFPSTHSSSVVAAATSLALERGFSDSIFGVTLVYAGLVMYDAQGVRREVGNHAKVLNAILAKRWVSSVVYEDRDSSIDSCEETSEPAGNFEGFGPALSKKSSSLASKTVNASLLIASEKEKRQTFEFAADDFEVLDHIRLKESIGHTEVEVVAGALLGFLVSLAVYSIIM